MALYLSAYVEQRVGKCHGGVAGGNDQLGIAHHRAGQHGYNPDALATGRSDRCLYRGPDTEPGDLQLFGDRPGRFRVGLGRGNARRGTVYLSFVGSGWNACSSDRYLAQCTNRTIHSGNHL